MDCGETIVGSFALDVTRGKNFRIDWGDGVVQILVRQDKEQFLQHSYPSTGLFTVTLIGEEEGCCFTGFYCPEGWLGRGDITLDKLDVRDCPDLKALYCKENWLENLDLTQNKALEILNCRINRLTELDVSQNVNLVALICDGYRRDSYFSDCGLTHLDVSKNVALIYLNCSCNRLTKLDVSKNVALAYLGCSDNKLTELDVSHNQALKRVICSDNCFTGLFHCELKDVAGYKKRDQNINISGDWEYGDGDDDSWYFVRCD
jgi:hypothetical protein